MEIADKAPMPGRTPIRLPIITPKNDHMRLCGCSATPKPDHKSAIALAIMSHPPKQRELHLQQPPEDDHADGHHYERKNESVKDGVLAIGAG